MIASIAAPLACRSVRIAGIATLTMKASATARNWAAETVARAYQRREGCVSMVGTPLMMVPRMETRAAPIDYVTGNDDAASVITSRSRKPCDGGRHRPI